VAVQGTAVARGTAVPRRAVVLGGSIAGLLVARVLSDHAESVVVVEPDDLTVPGDRLGTPQAVQLHVLLDMGRIQMERWLPGLAAELVADGAVPAAGAAVQHYLDGEFKVPVTGHELIGVTRSFLEARIRRRVLGLPNVEVVRGRAVGLTADLRRVTGAHYLPQGQTRREHLAADLVVDATGRSSRIGAWLEQIGWEPPVLERMEIDLGYATAFFRRGDELPGVFASLSLVSPSAPGGDQRDTSALAEVEGGRWIVVLAAYADRRPTADRDEFLARCGKIDAPPFREVAARCEMLGEVSAYRLADSRRRHFWDVRRFPAGLLAAGDAVASFNPVYGQGMASAALHASCLSSYLRSGVPLDEPAWEYFRRVRVVADAAWQTSALGDLAQPHVPGPYPRGYRAATWYVNRLLRASVTDAEVNRRFLDVANMLAHPRLLTHPGTVLRVARALHGRRRR
jgi:2-polyprenyl-6-methoxyphenol hydroxylase-like FAD-dependent oxidoreductase